MEMMCATTYQGFSRVSGSISLINLVEMIRSPKYHPIISKIRELMKEGKMDEMQRVKRQLDFFTITAQYGKERKPHSLLRYNDLITIDIDGLTSEQVTVLRPLIEEDPATIICFRTAKGHGFKIIAYLKTEVSMGLRRMIWTAGEIAYAQLEEYHGRMYQLTQEHYERVTGVEVDTSGKDLSRGVFASYDPEAFFDIDRLNGAMEVVIPPIVTPDPNAAPVKRKADGRPVGWGITEGGEAMTTDSIDPATRMEFEKCVAAVRRTVRYDEGSHNTFLFTLGNKCHARGLERDEVMKLAALEFGENGRWDTDTPIANGYTYTDKSERKKKGAGQKIDLVQEYLKANYDFRHNMIMERLEVRPMPQPDEQRGAFKAVGARDLNSIYCKINQAGIAVTHNVLKMVVESDFAEAYDPIANYFEELPQWNGKADYIGRLAATIETDDDEFWHDSLRRWIVSMVACAMGVQEANQQVLLLYGGQGKGKSTWIRRLLPPELKEYYRNGMIRPTGGDDLLMLSTRLIINMEEFEGMKQSDVAELKRIVAIESVLVRKPYGVQPEMYRRRASFVGSTNSLQFLKDMTGSRRFLVSTVKRIDYQTEVNHTGVYSQAKALIKSGFRYWYEGDEVDRINNRNEVHRVKDPLEEIFHVFFRRPTPSDYIAQWKAAAMILAELCVKGRIMVNVQSQQTLVQVLEDGGFRKRKNDRGVVEYHVVALTYDEVDRNSRKREEEVQLKMLLN